MRSLLFFSVDSDQPNLKHAGTLDFEVLGQQLVTFQLMTRFLCRYSHYSHSCAHEMTRCEVNDAFSMSRIVVRVIIEKQALLAVFSH